VPSIPPRAVAQKEEHIVAKDDIDPEDIDVDIDIEGDEIDILEDLGDDPLLVDEDDVLDDDDGDDEDAVGATVVRKAGDDDDDDDDMVAPDDVEEDLASILKDRLASEDLPAEEDEVVETDDRTADDALQPKKADEVQCTNCFLLVRNSAPSCPMGDDTCPLFPPK
jgi:hypothetical protein